MLPFRASSGHIKPAGTPRIDWRHPLANKLLFYGFDTGTAKTGIVDLVKGMQGTLVPGSTDAVVGPSPYGQIIDWQQAGGVFFPSDAAIRSATAAGNWSAACAFYGQGTTFTATVFQRCANNGSTQPFLNWGFSNNDANATGGVSGVASFGFDYDSDGAISRTGNFNWASPGQFTYVSLAGVFAGPAAGAQGIISFYGNGSLVAQDNPNDGGDVDTGDDIMFANGSPTGIASQLNGGVFYGGFWGRPLSAEEVLLLHEDPYCFLIFPEDELMAEVRGNRLFTQSFSPSVKTSPSLAEAKFSPGKTISSAVSGVSSMISEHIKPQFVTADALSSLSKMIDMAKSSTADSSSQLAKIALKRTSSTVNALATLASTKFRAFPVLSATAKVSSSVVHQFGHVVSAAAEVSIGLAHSFLAKILAGTAGSAGSFGRILIKLAIASPTKIEVAALGRAFTRRISAISATAGAVGRAISTAIAASGSAAPALRSLVGKAVTGTAHVAAQLARASIHGLAIDVQAAAALLKAKVTQVVGSAGASAAVTRVLILATRLAIVSGVPSLARAVQKILTAAPGLGPVLQHYLTRLIVAGTVIEAPSLFATVIRPVSAMAHGSAILVKTAEKVLAAAAHGMALTVGAQFKLTTTASVDAVASVSKMPIKILAGAAQPIGSLLTSLIFNVKRIISIGSETLAMSTVANEFFGAGTSLGLPTNMVVYNRPSQTNSPSVQMPGRSIFIGQGNDPIAAGADATWKFQLLDENGQPIGVSALASLELTIVDTVTGNVVNGVQDQNILNQDRGTVDSQGNVVIVLNPADNSLVNSTDQMEERSLIAIWTYNGGARTGKHQADYQIQALSGS